MCALGLGCALLAAMLGVAPPCFAQWCSGSSSVVYASACAGSGATQIANAISQAKTNGGGMVVADLAPAGGVIPISSALFPSSGNVPIKLILGPATYCVSSPISPPSGWNRVEIEGAAGGGTVLKQGSGTACTTATTNNIISLAGASDISIRHLEFQTAATSDQSTGAAIYIGDGVSSVRITDNQFTELRSNAIYVVAGTAGIDHLWVERNRFYHDTNTSTVDTCDVHLAGASGGSIYSASVNASGSSYTVGDVVTVVQSGASGGELQVTGVDGTGGVTSLSVYPNNYGSGYVSAYALATTGGSGTGLTVNIATPDEEINHVWIENNRMEGIGGLANIDSSGNVTQVGGIADASVYSGGSGYSVGEVLTVSQSVGGVSASNGKAYVTSVGSGGAVTGVSVLAQGIGYVPGQNLSVTVPSGGTGSGATLNIIGVNSGIPFSSSVVGSSFGTQDGSGNNASYTVCSYTDPTHLVVTSSSGSCASPAATAVSSVGFSIGNYHGIELENNVHHAVISGNQITGKYWHGIVITNEVNSSWTQPNNSDILISGNQVSWVGAIAYYIQSPGRGIVLTGNSSSFDQTAATNHASHGLEGAYFVNAGRGRGDVTLAGNSSYNDFYQAFNMVGSAISSQAGPPAPCVSSTSACGGVPVSVSGFSVVNPNQKGAASPAGGVTVNIAGGYYYGPIVFNGLTIRGDTNYYEGVNLDVLSTPGSFSGAVIADSSIDFPGQSGVQVTGTSSYSLPNVSVRNVKVSDANAYGIYAAYADGFSATGNTVRDYDYAGGGGAGIAVGGSVGNYTVTGNLLKQTLSNGGSDYGIQIGSTAAGLAGKNYSTGAQTANYYFGTGASGRSLLENMSDTNTSVNPGPGTFNPVVYSQGASTSVTFDGSKGNLQIVTLTGGPVSSSISNCVAGEVITFDIVEGGVGGYSFSWPTYFHSGGTINTTVGYHNRQTFYCDGTNGNQTAWAITTMQSSN